MIFQMEDDLHITFRRSSTHGVKQILNINRIFDAPNESPQLVDDLNVLGVDARAEVGPEVLVVDRGPVELLERVGLHQLCEVDWLRVCVLWRLVPGGGEVSVGKVEDD